MDHNRLLARINCSSNHIIGIYTSFSLFSEPIFIISIHDRVRSSLSYDYFSSPVWTTQTKLFSNNLECFPDTANKYQLFAELQSGMERHGVKLAETEEYVVQSIADSQKKAYLYYLTKLAATLSSLDISSEISLDDMIHAVLESAIDSVMES